MEPWVWLDVGVDVTILLLAIRMTFIFRNHQQVSIQVSQRFAPHFVVVGEDK